VRHKSKLGIHLFFIYTYIQKLKVIHTGHNQLPMFWKWTVTWGHVWKFPVVTSCLFSKFFFGFEAAWISDFSNYVCPNLQLLVTTCIDLDCKYMHTYILYLSVDLFCDYKSKKLVNIKGMTHIYTTLLHTIQLYFFTYALFFCQNYALEVMFLLMILFAMMFCNIWFLQILLLFLHSINLSYSYSTQK
jgi:hypothetical protein